MRYDARCIYGIWAVDIANWVIIYFVTPFTKAWMIHWYTIGICEGLSGYVLFDPVILHNSEKTRDLLQKV